MLMLVTMLLTWMDAIFRHTDFWPLSQVPTLVSNTWPSSDFSLVACYLLLSQSRLWRHGLEFTLISKPFNLWAFKGYSSITLGFLQCMIPNFAACHSSNHEAPANGNRESTLNPVIPCQSAKCCTKCP